MRIAVFIFFTVFAFRVYSQQYDRSKLLQNDLREFVDSTRIESTDFFNSFRVYVIYLHDSAYPKDTICMTIGSILNSSMLHDILPHYYFKYYDEIFVLILDKPKKLDTFYGFKLKSFVNGANRSDEYERIAIAQKLYPSTMGNIHHSPRTTINCYTEIGQFKTSYEDPILVPLDKSIFKDAPFYDNVEIEQFILPKKKKD